MKLVPNLTTLAIFLVCFGLPIKALADPTKVLESRRGLPAYFVENSKSQKTGERLVPNSAVVAFIQMEGGRVLFTADGAYLRVVFAESELEADQLLSGPPSPASNKQGIGDALGFAEKYAVMKFGMPKSQVAKRKIQPQLGNPSGAQVNFFLGPQSSWRSGLATYQTLSYANVWDGIFLNFTAQTDALISRLTVTPGANPNSIVMETGMDQVQLQKNGKLKLPGLSTSVDVPHARAFQLVAGEKRPISLKYRLKTNDTYGFQLGFYDESMPLIIEQTLVWSTYFGSPSGNGVERSSDIAVDGSGNAYLTGQTASADFPTTVGAYDTDWNGGPGDVFIAKMNTTGTGIVHATFLGGASEEGGTAIAVDASGNAYVCGFTESADFPSTAEFFKNQVMEERAMFIARLNAAGTDLDFAVLVGGIDQSSPVAIGVDASLNVLVAGNTSASTLPTTVGSFDPTHNGGFDAFALKLNALGTSLDYATYLGGSSTDICRDMAVDASGQAYLAGNSSGGNFPGFISGSSDQVFAAKLSSDGSSLIYSKVWGGSSIEAGHAIAIDASGQAFVTGFTGSNNFPTTTGAFQTSPQGSFDTFVTQLNVDGSDFVYSTYLGGSDREFGDRIVTDSAGKAVVVGRTRSTDYPVTAGVIAPMKMGTSDDLFITKINQDGSALEVSTYFGGSFADAATGVAIGPNDSVYMTGFTSSKDFPTTVNALDTTHLLQTENFVSKLNPQASALEYSTFLEGHAGESGRVLAIDAGSNPVISGSTFSTSFPTTPGILDDTFHGHTDIFVAKMNADGSGLIFSTYLGGQFQDISEAIFLDETANIFLAGWTVSDDFPVTAGAYDTTLNLSTDIFVTKLSADGSALIYSTFMGGANRDRAYAMTADGMGNTYLTGYTYSTDFPTTPGAFDDSLDGTLDVFVAKLNTAGSDLVFSTYLGSTEQFGVSNVEGGFAIATDQEACVYVGGSTISPGFPTTPGAFDRTFEGDSDMFVTKMNPMGTGLIFSTLIGGSDSDTANDLVLGDANNVFLTGGTTSNDFPVTPDAYDSSSGGSQDAVVLELLPDGSNLTYATFLSGRSVESGFSLALGRDHSIYVAGLTVSDDFPVTVGTFDSTYNGAQEVFVTKLMPGESTLAFSTYLGGEERDTLNDFALDAAENMFIFGTTTSADFPTTTGVIGETQGGYGDVFLTKLHACDLGKVVPSSVALGLQPPQFDIDVTCDIPQLGTAWSATPSIALTSQGTGIAIDPPPTVTTELKVMIMSDTELVTTSTARLLVAHHAVYLDLNGDGCNNLEDLWALITSWNQPLIDDPSGDSVIDIRDFLYLNLSDPVPCP